ncbi:MAG: gfo/Idh/MocA family oxidoreductase [Planctomycetota bacterium]|nr:MAG: gfo/Idh/MocA family oxidoreductase [Planctomycetota bacterium]
MANSPGESSRPSRRHFLQTSSAALAAASLTSLAQPVHAAGDETLRIALVGCGNRGTGAAANALQTAGPLKLWAMADAFEDRLAGSLGILQKGGRASGGAVPTSVAKRVDVPKDRQFVGLDAYRQAIDACDVVLICAPPGFRADHFEYAVAQGKHVFMEKPVATDPAGVRRVLAAAKAARDKDLKVGVGLQRHHDVKYRETIQRLQDGAIGDLHTLRAYWNGGTIKRPVDRADLTEMQYQVRNWYFFTWLSGDHIVEQHVHNLDVCNWLMNGHPVSAVGMGGRLMRTGKDYGDIFDHHAVEYTYADGTKMFGYCRQMPGCEPLVGEFATGTRGTADVGKYRIEAGDNAWHYPRTRRNRGSKYAADSPYQVEHDVLFAAIRSGTPHNEAETGAEATMTAILGRMATYTGRTVTWDEGFASQCVLTPETMAGWDTAPRKLPDSDGLYRLPMPGIDREV